MKMLFPICILIRVLFSAPVSIIAQNAQTPAATQTIPYTAENEGWLVSVDEAYKLSKKTGRPILANFTGSDWCGWCKKLTADVFTKPEFKEWAAKNVILLELDFPRRKALPEEIKSQNMGMQQAFNVRGYPTIWLFDLEKDAEGKFNVSALGQTGYRNSPDIFIGDLEAMFEKRANTGK
jgi:thioredoxin-related protein